MRKKMIIIVATTLLFSGCDTIEDDKNMDGAWTGHDMTCFTLAKIVEVEGHKYIVMDGPHTGVRIFHSASCSCMEEKKLP